MSYGFVYMLHNRHMTCFKIGCTERSPHARAEELSKPTGVPSPFIVACYLETKDFQDIERRMHGWLAEYRLNEQREFFDDTGACHAVALMYHWIGKLSFAVADHGYLSELLSGRPVSEIYNPWKPAAPAPEAEEAPALRVVGGSARGFD